MADKSFWDRTISFTDGTTLKIEDVKEIAYDVGNGEFKVVQGSDLVTSYIPITSTLCICSTNGENLCVYRDNVRYIKFEGPPF